MRRFLAWVLVASALALPLAAAQANDLDASVSPASATAAPGVEARTTLTVANRALRVIVVDVSWSAPNGTSVSLDRARLTLAPGASDVVAVGVRANATGARAVTLVAQEAGTVAPLGARAEATFSLTVSRASGNATSPPATNDTTSPPPTNDSTGGTPPADPPSPEPPPRFTPEHVGLRVRRGATASVLFALEGASEAPTLILPDGWTGALDARADGWRLDVTAGDGARDAEGAVAARGPGGTARLTLALAVEPEPVAAPAPPPAEATPQTAPAPTRATMRVEPDVIELAPGGWASAVAVVENPTGGARVGYLMVDATFARAPEDAVTVDAGRSARIAFLVTIPEDAEIGARFEATATFGEASAPFSVLVVAPASQPDAPAVEATPAWPVALAVALGVGALVTAPAWRRWVPALALPLYARLAPHRALEHPTRRDIEARVRAQPGITLAQLQRETGLANGVLRHHTRFLQTARIVRTTQDGQLRRLWPAAGARVEDVAGLGERALGLLRTRGPTSASALAAELGVTRQALHYHVRRLEREGRLRATRRPEGLVLEAVAPTAASSAKAR